MCGRYAYLLPPEAMAELFKLLNRLDNYPPRYNIAPTQPVVVVAERMGQRTGELFRWGFVPGWVKDPREWPLLINARAESMVEKPAFRDALRNTRCIVPATGYYEWQKGGDGSRRPYYITSRQSETMAFAGLYSTWAGPNGEEVDTVCIVTVPPNAEIAAIYDRMPAILSGDAIDAWLDREVEARDAMRLIASAPDGSMQFHPVGRDIGKATAEGAELIAEVAIEPPKPPSGQLSLF